MVNFNNLRGIISIRENYSLIYGNHTLYQLLTVKFQWCLPRAELKLKIWYLYLKLSLKNLNLYFVSADNDSNANDIRANRFFLGYLILMRSTLT